MTSKPDAKPEKKAQAIFTERAGHYAKSAVHRDAKELAQLVGLAGPEPNWRALDVATGTGHTAFAFAPHVRKVHAVDLTLGMLHEALSLQKNNGIQNVDFSVADAHRLPFGEGVFNLVVSRRAPHHFSNIKGALGDFARVLTNDGTLVINDRSVPEDDFVDETMNLLDLYHDRSHIRQYRPSEWTAMLTQTGFYVESCELSHTSRPLTSLTKDVVPEDVARIEDVLSTLASDQRQKLGLTETNGEPYINHWFVMIRAAKGDGA